MYTIDCEVAVYTRKRSMILSRVSFTAITLFITMSDITMQNTNVSDRFDRSTGTLKCSNGMPEFTGAKPYGYSNSQARKACACIKSNYVVSGWEEDVWRKVKRGDTSDWRTGALMNRMKSAINKCAKENNI